MSYTLAIRDALKTHVEAQLATWAHPFTVTAEIAPPTYTLAELASLRVAVVPLSVRTERATRAQHDNDVAVDVGLALKLIDDGPTVADLVALVETLNASLATLTPTDAVFVSSEIETLADEADYRTRRVFRSLITATYRVRR